MFFFFKRTVQRPLGGDHGRFGSERAGESPCPRVLRRHGSGCHRPDGHEHGRRCEQALLLQREPDAQRERHRGRVRPEVVRERLLRAARVPGQQARRLLRDRLHAAAPGERTRRGRFPTVQRRRRDGQYQGRREHAGKQRQHGHGLQRVDLLPFRLRGRGDGRDHGRLQMVQGAPFERPRGHRRSDWRYHRRASARPYWGSSGCWHWQGRLRLEG